MPASLTDAANELNASRRSPRDIMPTATFVLPDLKMAYVTNLKAACSTFKWLFADLAGQDASRLYRSIARRPTRAQTVHDRSMWLDVPHLGKYDQLAEVSPDNGWLVFSFVRDPRSRLWSAWQSKLLTGNPNYLGRPVVSQPWYPRLPNEAFEVVEDFQRFVEAMRKSRRRLPRVSRDGHFRPQSDLLYRKGLQYTRVYDLSEIPTFERDLAAHLIDVGHDSLPELRNDNDTPLQLTKDVLASGMAEAIEDIYAEDFERFGAVWEEGPTMHEGPWSDAVYTDIAFRRAAHQRIRDLSDAAAELETDNDRLRAELDG